MDPSFRRDGAFAWLTTRNWDEFKVKVGAHLTGGSRESFEKAYGRFLFRGQSCSSWPLVSGFDRRNQQLSPAAAKQKYDLMMQRFRDIAPIYGAVGASLFSERFDQLDKLKPRDLETLAQHYGLPTRLVDWTMSLYVGAFFAFSKIDECKSGLVSVWILDAERSQKEFSNEHLEFVRDVYRENVRQLWQMGAFTYNRSPLLRLEDLFRENSAFCVSDAASVPPLLLRVDLPVSEAERVLDDLNMMRINGLSLFPGIDGVVRWIEQGGYAFPLGSG